MEWSRKMSFTRQELEDMEWIKLLKVAKFFGVDTYRTKKEIIIDELDKICNPSVVEEDGEVQKSVRIRRIYGE